MVRPSQDADAPYVDGMVHGDGLTSLQFRRTKGAITEQKESTVKGADVIQIERKGQTYIFSAAKFGDPFTTSEVSDVTLGDEVLVGLALCSHNGDVTERALFKDVRIVRPAKDGFVPYRDYIGSVLEMLDLQSGRKQVLHRSENPIEAPNWTRDGKSLIFNTSGRVAEWRGRLHRFDLATRQSTPIDTGTNNRNNNDHVLSFDGKMLGISDQSIQGTGSTIYTVPVGGGTPKRITQLAPSYLHSWSPDGKLLIYTGGRNNEFDIYSIASDGSGSEVNLTNSKGLDDGPEYTPDGKYIYFNSVRSGPDADLADDAGRQESGTGHQRRVQQLVPAHLARWPVDRHHQLPEGHRPDRSSVLQARLHTRHADRRRHAQGRGLRLWRAGDDQRAVVVAGQQEAGVRE